MTTPHTPVANSAPSLTARTPRQVRAALKRAAGIRRPIFLWGAMGIGKSQTVRAVADALFAADYGLRLVSAADVSTVDTSARFFPADGALVDTNGIPTSERPYFLDLRGSLLDPVDLRGLPVPDMVRRLTDWLTPGFLPTSGRGIIFLDELPRAPVAVQNALLQLALDRRIGDYVLPDGWVVVAAGNRAADGGVGVGKLDLALAKRFFHITMVPDVGEWIEWAKSSSVHPIVVAFHEWRRSNASFLNLFFAPNPKEHATPDPRSWEYVSDLLHSHEADPEEDEVLLSMVAGIIGEGPAVEFMAFLSRYSQLMALGDPLGDPLGATVPDDMGTRYAIASSLAARATLANLADVVTYLERLPAEFATFAIKDATTRDPALKATSTYTAWAIAHQDEHK